MKKYASVDTTSELPIKCRKTKMSDRRTMEPKLGEYARPHARAVSRRKKEWR